MAVNNVGPVSTGTVVMEGESAETEDGQQYFAEQNEVTVVECNDVDQSGSDASWHVDESVGMLHKEAEAQNLREVAQKRGVKAEMTKPTPSCAAGKALLNGGDNALAAGSGTLTCRNDDTAGTGDQVRSAAKETGGNAEDEDSYASEIILTTNSDCSLDEFVSSDDDSNLEISVVTISLY